MVTYKIVEGAVTDVAYMVNTLLKNGWKLQGPLVVVSSGQGGVKPTIVAQAMILEEEDPIP